ncbi:MAG: hypothetical protein KGH94_05375 [Candidatus Micrarchaeota archaeon]|nr:hypothetical protein [Candidatus Micrarchaeota archaeon]
MKETKVSFKSGKVLLYGILHTPDRSTGKIIVFANGWPDNYVDIHIMTAAARYFCSKGYAFLRFNPKGRWPSNGIFINQGVLDQAEDTSSAVRFARRKGYGRIALIGHSMGGLAILAAKGAGADVLALWEPGSARMLKSHFGKKKYRQQFRKQGYAVEEQYGQVISKKYIVDLTKIPGDAKLISSISLPILLAAGTPPNSILRDVVKYYYKFAKGPKELVIIKGASHTFDNYNHEKELFRRTLAWFRKTL